jgi:hypothetical protein
VRSSTNPDLDVPTGITAFLGAVYAVDAKLGPDVPHEAVRVSR